MRTLYLSTLICTLAGASLAAHNVTLNSTDPAIHYEGNAGDASICKVNPDGNLSPAQGGCYLIRPNCTLGVAMGQGGTGAAFTKFKGENALFDLSSRWRSAVYVWSALNQLSPIYTVTVDGESTDVDGVRDSLPFSCYPLFSKTDLDPSVEHDVRLSVKGPSPNRNMSIQGSENAFNFALISFIYTAGDDATNSSSSTTNSSAGTNTTSAPATSSKTSGGTTDFSQVVASPWSMIGSIVALAYATLFV